MKKYVFFFSAINAGEIMEEPINYSNLLFFLLEIIKN